MAKRGRPPLSEKDRKSEPVGIRLTPELRAWLEKARREGDVERTLSQEIVLRLREAFEKVREIERRFGGPATAALLEILADRIRSIEISTGGLDAPGGNPSLRWFNDRFTYDQVRSMIDVVLDHLKPAGRRTIPERMRWHPRLKRDVENLGRHAALLALSSLQSAASFSKESEVQALYDRAALPLGRRLRGSPIDKLWKEQEQTRRRLLKKPVKRNVAAETKAALVKVLDSYLRPPRLIEGAKVNIARILKGINCANFAQERQEIIERIKRAVKGKLANPAASLDDDIGLLLDAAAAPISDETKQRILDGERK